jgi:hypothetical protein
LDGCDAPLNARLEHIGFRHSHQLLAARDRDNDDFCFHAEQKIIDHPSSRIIVIKTTTSVVVFKTHTTNKQQRRLPTGSYTQTPPKFFFIFYYKNDTNSFHR